LCFSLDIVAALKPFAGRRGRREEDDMFARTERLLLRPAWGEDATALARIADDEAVARNLARLPSPYTLEDAEAYIAFQQASALPSLLIFRRTRSAPKLIGGIGIDARADGGHELGYWLTRPCWGLGYATEAGRAMVALARDGLRLKRIEAGHFPDNPASGRVLRKLGFRPTGEVVMQRSAARGAEVPALRYSLDLTANGELHCDESLAEACQMAA
jgi:RimJ/RimL family protein N-acetyltransferase